MHGRGKANRIQLIAALMKACSISRIVRTIGVAKHTIAKLSKDIGYAPQILIAPLGARRFQCDEIWALIGD
jgi:hypothetical protein